MQPAIAVLAPAAMAPDARVLLDDVISYDITPSPEKVDTKRARRLTPLKHRLPSPRRAASQPERPRTGRSPARRSAWPDVSAAEHRQIPFDPAVSDADNPNKLAEQVKPDGGHVATLKAGIGRLHEAVEAHATIIAQHEDRLSGQSAVDLRGFKERADLRTQLTDRSM